MSATDTSSADIVLGDTDMSVVTFVKNSTRQIKLVEDGKEIKLPDPGKYLGREFVGWECSLNDRVYPEGYEYKVTRDVTFTAVWETADYDIVIDDDILHGDIWTSPKSEAEAGDTVHVYADPDAGYVLEDLSVTYRSGRYELKLTASAPITTPSPCRLRRLRHRGVHLRRLPLRRRAQQSVFYDAVYYVWANDLMEGVDYDEFNPNGTMTRAMFWAVLGRIDGETITGSDWADEARDWAMSEGVSDGTNPNGLVTREQMVTMLWRYARRAPTAPAISAATPTAIRSPSTPPRPCAGPSARHNRGHHRHHARAAGHRHPRPVRRNLHALL